MGSIPAKGEVKHEVPTTIDALTITSRVVTIDEITKRQLISNFARGCWFGYHHRPLMSSLTGTNPFVIVRVSRKETASDTMHDEGGLIEIWLENSAFRTSASISVSHQTTSEIVTIFTMPVPTAPNSTETDITRRMFQFDRLAHNQVSNYIVSIGNEKCIEGEYHLGVRCMSELYDVNLYVPRQYARGWMRAEDLKIPTTIVGSWKRFRTYGGAPNALEDYDWMLHNPSCIIAAKDTTKCLFTLTKTDFSDSYADKLGLDWADRRSGYGIGLVVLKLQTEESRTWDSKLLEDRIIAHSEFPIKADNQIGKSFKPLKT
jgi:hypothetical protein